MRSVGLISEYLKTFIGELSEKNEEGILEKLINIHSLSVDAFNQLNNLVAWARVRKENLAVTVSGFSVGKALAEVINFARLMARSKMVEIDTDGRDNIFIKTDETRFKAIVRNLLLNTVKFSRPDGIVELRYGSTNGFLIVKVRDFGIGMTADKLEQILGASNIVQSTKGTRGEQGFGTGLFICKDFLQRLGVLP